MKQLKYLFFLPTSLILILLSCGKTSVDVYSSGNWVSNYNNIPGPNRESAVSFVIGRLAYVGTGFNSTITFNNGQNRLTDFYSFDPSVGTTGAWAYVASIPGKGRSNAVAFAIGTNGYVTLGQDSVNVLMSETWQYNSINNTWTQKGDFGNGSGANQVYATPRVDASAFAIGNFGYVLCGYDNTGSYKKDSWVYDPSSDHWNLTATQFDGSSRKGAITFVRGDSVAYIVTGINGQNVPDMIKFNPANTSEPWKPMGEIINVTADTKDDDYTDIERSYGVGMVMGDSAYITLGYPNLVKTWGYDFKNDQWFRKTSFEKTGSQQGRTNAVSFVVQGRGYIATGVTGGTELGDIVEWQPYVSYNSYD